MCFSLSLSWPVSEWEEPYPQHKGALEGMRAPNPELKAVKEGEGCLPWVWVAQLMAKAVASTMRN